MSDAWRGDPRQAKAVSVAAALMDLHGVGALDEALGRQRSAHSSGNIRRADLYLAVCTILRDRDGVVSRWRAPSRSDLVACTRCGWIGGGHRAELCAPAGAAGD